MVKKKKTEIYKKIFIKVIHKHLKIQNVFDKITKHQENPSKQCEQRQRVLKLYFGIYLKIHDSLPKSP